MDKLDRIRKLLGVSNKVAEKLVALGCQSEADLVAVDAAELLDGGLSTHVVLKIARAVTRAGGTVEFAKPNWSASQWQEFVEKLVSNKIVRWEEIAICLLGELNPPQVGTSTASNENIKKQFPPRKCMQAVMAWFYAQNGRCAICGTRVHIEVDHITSKEEFEKQGKSAAEADTLDNLQLLCKRCNVGKRPSHLMRGSSFHTTQSALMWILFALKPKNIEEFSDLCRRYGLTMASVRFQEAWAQAEWLKKAKKYPLD